MSGNPLEARMPLKGLVPGDHIAYTVVAESVIRDSHAFKMLVERLKQEARGDVLVLTLPSKRREAVVRNLDEALREVSGE